MKTAEETFTLPWHVKQFAKFGSVLKFNIEGTCRICTPDRQCSLPFKTKATTREERMEIARRIVEQISELSGFEPCPEDSKCNEIRLI